MMTYGGLGRRVALVVLDFQPSKRRRGGCASVFLFSLLELHNASHAHRAIVLALALGRIDVVENV